MDLPNFLIVGASKAGTSSVWNYLNEHSEIFLPRPKEPLFFIKEVYNKFNIRDPGYREIQDIIVQDEKTYKEIFSTKTNYKCKGESTASYLYYYKTSIPNIIKLLGRSVKIIIILRNPVDKVISHYKFYLGKGFENNTLKKALQLEKERIEKGYNPFYHYKNQGYYYESVKAFLTEFKNVHICLYEDLIKNPQLFLCNIFDFLNVSRIDIGIANTIYNKSYVPKNRQMLKVLNYININFKFIKKIFPFIHWKSLKQVIFGLNENKNFSIDDDLLGELASLYKNDILKLEKLTGINISEKWSL